MSEILVALSWIRPAALVRIEARRSVSVRDHGPNARWALATASSTSSMAPNIATPLSAEAAEGDESAEGERAAPSPARRRRFGPSEAGLSYSPVQQYSSRVPDEDIDDEVAALAAALRDAGPGGMDRRTLGERVNCRLWGPGRYRHALSTALARGAIRHTGRGRYAAEQEALSRGR